MEKLLKKICNVCFTQLGIIVTVSFLIQHIDRVYQIHLKLHLILLILFQLTSFIGLH